ncbi:hypothetical protein BHE74_00026594 [Ensete ventricosum]|nr:hypothetical protein BHE74_00026594 [Ensete ventricosum]
MAWEPVHSVLCRERKATHVEGARSGKETMPRASAAHLKPTRGWHESDRESPASSVVLPANVCRAVPCRLPCGCQLVYDAYCCRKFKGSNLPARIAECRPSFCTVYVVSKGKLLSVCASVSEMDETASTSITDDSAKEEDDSSALSSSFSSNSRNPISGSELCLFDTICN